MKSLIVQNVMSWRMKIQNDFAFAFDMFEIMRKKSKKWRDLNRKIECEFHDHENENE